MQRIVKRGLGIEVAQRIIKEVILVKRAKPRMQNARSVASKMSPRLAASGRSQSI